MLRYGIDIQVPTTVRGDDGWRPLMETSFSRFEFDTQMDLAVFLDRFERTNRLKLRVVELRADPMEPIFRS